MKKILSAFIAAVYFSVNCVLAHSTESNFWASRRAASQRVKGETANLQEGASAQRGNLLLAQLPMASPVDLARGKVDSGQDTSADGARTPFSVGPATGDWLGKMVSPYGSVRDVYLSPKKDAPFIVHIQDAHGIEEAQRNISSMIEIVGQEPRIQLVGLEAAWGPFSLQPYRDYPDANITKEIADFFLKKGLIAGPEYAGLTLPSSPDFFGAEDKTLYDANVLALKTAYKNKQGAQTQLDVVVNNVAALKSLHYSEELGIFDGHFEGYHSEKEKLAVYVRYLVEINRSLKFTNQIPHPALRGPSDPGPIRPVATASHWQARPFPQEGKENKDFPSPLGRPVAELPAPGAPEALMRGQGEGSVPNLELLVRALDEEDRLNFKLVEKERRELVEQLARKLTTEQMQDLVAKSVDYRAGRVGYGDYHSHLIVTCRQHGISVGQWGHLNRYISYVMLADKIDKNGLLEEMDALDRAIPERLAKTADEKKLVSIAYDLTLMAKLLRHEMSPTDWAAYEKRVGEIHRLTDRLNELDPTGKWESLSAKTLKPFEDFCRYATQRNNALTDNLLRRMGETQAKSAVLVAGGFHTEGLSALLRQKQVSFVVVTPKISEIPRDNKYLDLLASDPVPLEKQLAGDRIYLARMVAMMSDESEAAGMVKALQQLFQRGMDVYSAYGNSALTLREQPGAVRLFTLMDKTVYALPAQHGSSILRWAGKHSVAIENFLIVVGMATMGLLFGYSSTEVLATVFGLLHLKNMAPALAKAGLLTGVSEITFRTSLMNKPLASLIYIASITASASLFVVAGNILLGAPIETFSDLASRTAQGLLAVTGLHLFWNNWVVPFFNSYFGIHFILARWSVGSENDLDELIKIFPDLNTYTDGRSANGASKNIDALKSQAQSFQSALSAAESTAREKGWDPNQSLTWKIDGMDDYATVSVQVNEGEDLGSKFFSYPAGWLTIHIHGSPTGFSRKTRKSFFGPEIDIPITATELAELIYAQLGENERNNKSPILLISCRSGSELSFGQNVAQQISKILNRPVVAPTDTLHHMRGFVIIKGYTATQNPTDWTPEGSWKTFLPAEAVKLEEEAKRVSNGFDQYFEGITTTPTTPEEPLVDEGGKPTATAGNEEAGSLVIPWYNQLIVAVFLFMEGDRWSRAWQKAGDKVKSRSFSIFGASITEVPGLPWVAQVLGGSVSAIVGSSFIFALLHHLRPPPNFGTNFRGAQGAIAKANVFFGAVWNTVRLSILQFLHIDAWKNTRDPESGKLIFGVGIQLIIRTVAAIGINFLALYIGGDSYVYTGLVAAGLHSLYNFIFPRFGLPTLTAGGRGIVPKRINPNSRIDGHLNWLAARPQLIIRVHSELMATFVSYVDLNSFLTTNNTRTLNDTEWILQWNSIGNFPLGPPTVSDDFETKLSQYGIIQTETTDAEMKGTFGEVRLLRRSNGEVWALKSVNFGEEEMTLSKAIYRIVILLSEAEQLEKLKNTGVLAVPEFKDSLLVGNHNVLAMQMARGDHPGEGPSKKINLKEAIAILTAVRDLHAAGFVHGDITSKNIILGESRATLIDLGASISQTETNVFNPPHFSLHYAAPEIAKGPTRGTDIYAVVRLLVDLMDDHLITHPKIFPLLERAIRDNDAPQDVIDSGLSLTSFRPTANDLLKAFEEVNAEPSPSNKFGPKEFFSLWQLNADMNTVERFLQERLGPRKTGLTIDWLNELVFGAWYFFFGGPDVGSWAQAREKARQKIDSPGFGWKWAPWTEALGLPGFALLLQSLDPTTLVASLLFAASHGSRAPPGVLVERTFAALFINLLVIYGAPYLMALDLLLPLIELLGVSPQVVELVVQILSGIFLHGVYNAIKAFDAKRLLNKNVQLAPVVRMMVVSLVSATFAVIVAPFVLANFSFPMGTFFLVSLGTQALDPTTFQAFSDSGLVSGMIALGVGTLSNFSTYAFSMGWAPMALLGFATSALLSPKVRSSMRKFAVAGLLAFGLAGTPAPTVAAPAIQVSEQQQNDYAKSAVIAAIEARPLAQLPDNLKAYIEAGNYRAPFELSDGESRAGLDNLIEFLGDPTTTEKAAEEYGRQWAIAEGPNNQIVAVLHGIANWEEKTRAIALAVVRGMLLAGTPVLVVAEEGFETATIMYSGQTPIEVLNIAELNADLMKTVESQRSKTKVPLASTVFIREEDRHVLNDTEFTALTFEGISRAIKNTLDSLMAALRAA
ncbi:MAG: protein kinase family protein [Elusimicrobia bacterium]|nr:protein kinase family protein [Elusimicrobiota bacterium]